MEKIPYSLTVNKGNEALGTVPTVTANEHIVEILDTEHVAEEINHLNPLIPAKVAQQVLDCFLDAALPLMARGKAIQFNDAKGQTMLKLYPDVQLEKSNGKAWTLEQVNALLLPEGATPLTALTEESIKGLNFAPHLRLTAYAEQGVALTNALKRLTDGFQRVSTKTAAYVSKKGEGNSGNDQGGGQQGGERN